MGIVIRANWLPATGASLDDRISEVIQAIEHSDQEPLTVGTWFDKGRSKKDALSRSFSLETLRTRRKPWRLVPLIPGEAYWALDLWNGRDGSASGSLSVAIFDPPSTSSQSGMDTDRLVLSGPELTFLRENGTPWPAVLDLARRLGDELGGSCIVTSHALWEKAEQDGLSTDSADVAYAAFWGVDRSGRNPRYRKLPSPHSRGPYSTIVSHSWQEVGSPDPDALRRLARLIG